MNRYTITCTVCGVGEEGWAYKGEQITHTHAYTGAQLDGQVRITVIS